MFRNLKALGLSLVAILAIGAIAAAIASAQEAQGEISADGPVKLDGTELGGKSNALTALGFKVECPGSTWKGHKYNVTPEEGVPAGSTTTTITPTYVNCVGVDGFGNHKATMTLNGCDYVFHIGETTGVESSYGVTTDVVCPEGQVIQIDVYAFAGSELGGIQCAIKIKAQAGLSGATVANDGEKTDMLFEGTLKGLSVERSGSGCTAESTSKGEWDFNATAKGTNSAEEATVVKVVDEPQPPQQGEIAVDGPVKLDGTELAGKSNALTAFGYKAECPGSTWTGHKYNVTPVEGIPGGSTSITIAATYPQEKCTSTLSGSAHKTTVTANGCDYVLHIGETTGLKNNYNVTTDIVCPEGKDIQVEVYPFANSELGGVVCTLTVKPQAGLTGPALTSNIEEGDLNLEGKFKGLSAEQSGSACTTESTSKGEWDFNVTAKGTNSAEEATMVKVVDEPAQQGEITADGSVTLVGTELGENALAAFEFTIECPGSSWTGHKYNVTPHERIPGGSTTATIVPTYVNCKAIESGTHKATVTTNECDYVLHLGETTGVEGSYNVSTDIICPEGKAIQMEIYPFSGSELGGAVCTLSVKSQATLTGPTLTSNGVAGDLQVEGTFKGVNVEKSGTACATESTSKGEWHFNSTINGINKAEEGTDVAISD